VIDKFDVNALGSIAGAPRNGTQIVPIEGSLTRGKVIIDPNDRLKVPHIYPGVGDVLGADLSKVPAVLGVRASGAPLELYFAGDEEAGRNLAHVLAVGMSGAGKSWFYRFVILNGMARGEAYSYVYGNARKTDQEPKWVLEGAERVARTKREVIDLLKWIRDEEIPRRSKLLGDAGFGHWSTAAYRATGVKFLDILLDEYAAVGLATDLGETLRSLGGRLVVGVQRATGGRINTDFRAQFSAVATFGVDNDDSAAIALTEAQQDAGCMPQAWKAKHPGKLYLDAPGVSDEEACEECRTFKPNVDRVNKWGEALVRWRRGGAAPGPMRGEAREATPVGLASPPARRGEGAEAYDDDEAEYDEAYEEALPPARHIDMDAPDEEVEAATAEAYEAATADDEEAEYDEEARAIVEHEKITPEEAAEITATDHVRPIEHRGGGMVLGLSPRMSDVDARSTARSMLLQLGTGKRFKVEDVLPDIMEETGMSAQWFSKWLAAWCDESAAYGPPILRRLDARGTYEIIGRRDVEAA
jgi:hypothetical protein